MKPVLKRYISEFVYGAVDGTVTTFAVVAASAGAGISSAIILVLGAANLIADGFSMGASAYLAASAEHDESARNTSKRASPKIIGFMTFAAFVAVGSVPVIPYLAHVLARGSSAAHPCCFISARERRHSPLWQLAISRAKLVVRIQLSLPCRPSPSVLSPLPWPMALEQCLLDGLACSCKSGQESYCLESSLCGYSLP